MATGVYGFDCWLVFQCGVGSKGGLARQRTGGLAQVHFLLARPFDAGRQLPRSTILFSRRCMDDGRRIGWCLASVRALPYQSATWGVPTDFISRMWGGVLFVAVDLHLRDYDCFFPLHFFLCVCYCLLPRLSRSLRTSHFPFLFGIAIKKKRNPNPKDSSHPS